MVVGENGLWAVEDSCVARTKVFDEDIACGVVVDRGGTYNVLVANFSNQMFVYSREYELLWAIKVEEVPVRVCVFGHQAFSGALAILT